ncbi:MAG: permease, partial [Pseudomonadota bacterium]
AIREILREGVTDQLIRDLQPIITSAVETAVTQVTQQARQLLLDELNGSLENHIRSLIASAVEREFMTKE